MNNAVDQLFRNTKGQCPHCGETSSEQFFDNNQDEYCWCYSCGKHSRNPEWVHFEELYDKRDPA